MGNHDLHIPKHGNTNLKTDRWSTEKCVYLSWIRLEKNVIEWTMNSHFQPRGYVPGLIINLFVLQAIPFVFSFITSPFIKVWPSAISSHFSV